LSPLHSDKGGAEPQLEDTESSSLQSPKLCQQSLWRLAAVAVADSDNLVVAESDNLVVAESDNRLPVATDCSVRRGMRTTWSSGNWKIVVRRLVLGTNGGDGL